MVVYSKQTARRNIQARLGRISDKEYALRSKKIYKYVARWLASAPDIRSVLLYQAFPKWREVAISRLEEDFKGVSFDYALQTKDAPFPAHQYDVIFVPLYGFTNEGYRLGHGGGWYDRMLSGQQQSLKVGVGFEEGRIDYLVESHDVRLDVIITDQRVSFIS